MPNGAQDYLVKGQVDGGLLARSIRYAIERRRAEQVQQQLQAARLSAAENARLERGLLATPLVDEAALGLATHHQPGLEPIDVLLVEDDAGDVLLIREAFEHNKVHNNLEVVSDGVDAIAFLRREGEYAEARRPDLVLLDLNLPRKDGRAVLAEIKEDPSCARSRSSC